MRRMRAIWGMAVLALLAPLCSQAESNYGSYAVVVNTLWPTCQRAPDNSRVPPASSWSRFDQLPAKCTSQTEVRPNAVGLLALEALQFSNKPEWARHIKRVQREGLRLVAVNGKATTFYVGINPDGVAGLHFVGTMSR